MLIIRTRIATSLGSANIPIEVPEEPAHIYNYALNLVATGAARIVPIHGQDPNPGGASAPAVEPEPEPVPDPIPDPDPDEPVKTPTKKKRGSRDGAS